MTLKVLAICSSEAVRAALSTPDPMRAGVVFVARTGSAQMLASVLRLEQPYLVLLDLPAADEQIMEQVELALVHAPGTHLALVSPDRSVEFLMRAMRAGDHDELIRIAAQTDWVAKRVFVPGGVLTLVTGAISTSIYGMWGQMWVVLSLLGIVASMGIGGAILSRSARTAIAEGTSLEGIAAAERLATFAQFDVILLFTIVGLMVLKPTWNEWWMMFVVAAIIGGAFYFLIYPRMQRRMAGA